MDLRRFNSLLVEKNKVLNLTAHKTEEDSWRNNIEDSLLLLDVFPKTGKMLDIGSGCGCPAIPLKIALPGLDVTMIDSVKKKVDFLSEFGRAIHTRIEDFLLPRPSGTPSSQRGIFDIVTARAVAPLPTLIEYALPFLKVGGMLYAFKGSKWQDEIDASANALKQLGGVVKDVKVHSDARSLILIQKTKPTDKKYPRKKNLPRLKPL